MNPDTALLDDTIRALAPLERAPGSPGEQEAADWLVERLRAEGCDVSVDHERIHGHFWRPVGFHALVALAGAFAALRGRRRLGGALAAVAGVGLFDEITCRTYLTRKLLGRRKMTTNVVAVAGDRDADRTVVVFAHHDAAQSGLIFHPGPHRFVAEHFPAVIESSDTAPPMWLPVLLAPWSIALGALTGRRGLVGLGATAAALTAGFMADIGRHKVVPGANDNLTGVAVLVAMAKRLREEPIDGVRVILLSAGAEETLQEGMRGFAARHFPSLPRETTRFINIDTLGCLQLVMLEGEGAVRMEDYDADFKDMAARLAERDGIPLKRGVRARVSTDGVVPMRAGYPTVTLVSMNAWKALDNYHWPTDVPDNVDLSTVGHALDLTDALVRELASQ